MHYLTGLLKTLEHGRINPSTHVEKWNPRKIWPGKNLLASRGIPRRFGFSTYPGKVICFIYTYPVSWQNILRPSSKLLWELLTHNRTRNTVSTMNFIFISPWGNGARDGPACLPDPPEYKGRLVFSSDSSESLHSYSSFANGQILQLCILRSRPFHQLRRCCHASGWWSRHSMYVERRYNKILSCLLCIIILSGSSNDVCCSHF